MDNPAMMFALFGVLFFAIVGIVLLAGRMGAHPRLAVQRYQAKWLMIESSLDRTNAASWQLAVMNADKLLDQALRDSRYRGKTMGERMKSAQKTWKNANHVWSAHKIRNQLAHETDANISYDIAARALAAYKQGLKDLGAI